MRRQTLTDKIKQELARKDVLLAASASLTILAMVSSFISGALALFLAGAFSLGYSALREYQRRTIWEKRMARDLTLAQNDIEWLAHESKRNNREIRVVKRGLSHAAHTIRDNTLSNHDSKIILKDLSADLNAVGKGEDLAAARRQNALMMDRRRAPGPANDGGVYSIQSARDRALQQTVKRALDSKKFKPFTQKIVSLDNQATHFQELYSRLHFRGEAYMPAGRFLDVARQGGYIADIDVSSLNFALKNATQNNVIFVNINCASLKSARFMNRLLGALSVNRALAAYIVFEIQQTDFEALDGPSYALLKGVSDLGCALSIDHVENFTLPYNLMRSLNLRFVKLSAKRLVQASRSRRGQEEIKTMKMALEAMKITPIVEHVEKPQDLRVLARYDFKYAQGFLFNRPALQKQEAA